jgi:hypothetical protein
MFRNLRLSTIGCAILAILVASVEAQQQPVAHHGRVRVHFISAEEIDWDYAPLGRDEAMGHPFGEFEKNYVEAGPHRIGRIYKKVVYREYTDAKFNRLLTRSADDAVIGNPRSRSIWGGRRYHKNLLQKQCIAKLQVVEKQGAFLTRELLEEAHLA